MNLADSRLQAEEKGEKEVRPAAKKVGTTAKKAKKTVFSKMDSKDGLLGNLLEETFNTCQDKK